MDKKENKIQLKKYERQQKVRLYEDKQAKKIKKKNWIPFKLKCW